MHLLAVGMSYGVKQWQRHRMHEATDDAHVVGNIIQINARVSCDPREKRRR